MSSRSGDIDRRLRSACTKSCSSLRTTSTTLFARHRAMQPSSISKLTIWTKNVTISPFTSQRKGLRTNCMQQLRIKKDLDRATKTICSSQPTKQLRMEVIQPTLLQCNVTITIKRWGRTRMSNCSMWPVQGPSDGWHSRNTID